MKQKGDEMETIKNFAVGLLVSMGVFVLAALGVILWPVLIGLGSVFAFIALIILGIIVVFYIIVLIGYVVRRGFGNDGRKKIS